MAARAASRERWTGPIGHQFSHGGTLTDPRYASWRNPDLTLDVPARVASRAPGAVDQPPAVDHQLSGPRVPMSPFNEDPPSGGDYGAYCADAGLTGDALVAQLQQTAEKFGAAYIHHV